MTQAGTNTDSTQQGSEGVARYDLLLRGGHVIDPKNGISKVLDVAIADGRIAAVGYAIEGTAEKIVDVSGYYVTPGLIDMHVHVDTAHYFRGSVEADGQSFSSGVTTMVDAGTAGAITFGEFKERLIDSAKTRILAYLNIVNLGMGGDFEQDVKRMDPVAAAGVAQAYPNVIVGIKGAHYWTHQPWDDEHQPWSCVDRGLEAAALCGKPFMIDFWPRPERPYEDLILKKLRPGDIHTHVFAQQFPIILEDGRVNPALFEAQERGVILDVGHGAGSFWFRNAVRAIRGGFVPNSISTDLHTGNAANGLVTNIANVMSKFLSMGLDIEKVIALTTVAPAQEIGHPELGTLDVGTEADVAVFELKQGQFGFIDCGRAKLVGNRRLRPVLTIRAGQVAYDPEGLTMPLWEEAPPEYWVCRQPGGATASRKER